MWITRELFERLLVRETEAKAAAQILSEQNNILRTHMDWMRVRVNQLEAERAAFLFDKAGIKIPVPEIQYDAHTRDYNELPSFEDIGDQEARRLGIKYGPDGTIIYES